MKSRITKLNEHIWAIEDMQTRHDKKLEEDTRAIDRAKQKLAQAKKNRGLIAMFASQKNNKQVVQCEDDLYKLYYTSDGEERMVSLRADTSNAHHYFVYGKCEVLNGVPVTGAFYYAHLQMKLDMETVELSTAKQVLSKKTKERKIAHLKVRAAANTVEIRSLAYAVKRIIKLEQLESGSKCPYCEANLDISDSHADHIYPVSRGGQSTKENMVYVCAKCNLSKRDKTLSMFITDDSLNRANIEASLTLLGKVF